MKRITPEMVAKWIEQYAVELDAGNGMAESPHFRNGILWSRISQLLSGQTSIEEMADEIEKANR